MELPLKDIFKIALTIGLDCDQCQSGFLGSVASLSEDVESGHFLCRQCGHRRPMELAYIDALRKHPFVNAFFVNNWTMQSIEQVTIGRPHAVKFVRPLDKLHYVNVTANASFPVHTAAVNQSSSGFVIISSTEQDPTPQEPVKVIWVAAGYVGPERFLFFEAIARAFEILHKDPLRTADTFRIALLEAIIAHEIFTTWCIRSFIWTSEYFERSNKKKELVENLIRDAGVTNLTQVPLRLALGNLDLYRVFSQLELPVKGNTLNLEDLLADIIQGVKLRNKVVHAGLQNVDEKSVERTVASIYFLMEATLLNLSTQAGAP